MTAAATTAAAVGRLDPRGQRRPGEREDEFRALPPPQHYVRDYGRALDEEVRGRGIVARFVEVTPQLAEMWLQRNRGNRNLSHGTVARYARDMARGAWTLSSQAITFSESGRLLNGQNRLHACLRAEVAFPSLVLFGMPEESFGNEDTPRRRSRKDRLDIQAEKRTALLSGAMAWLHTWECDRLDQVNLTQPTPDEERQLLERHPRLRDSVALVSRGVFKAIGWQPALAALHYIARLKDPVLADAFFDGLGTGEMLREGEPLYQLRRRLLQNRSASRKLARIDIAALVIKAWNMTRAGRTDVQVLMWRSGAEPFPEVE